MNPIGQRLSTKRPHLERIVEAFSDPPGLPSNRHLQPCTMLRLPAYSKLCVRDAFCQAVIMNHVLDVQIFKGYEPESINQAATDLMGEFVSLVSYSLMNSLNYLLRLRPRLRLGGVCAFSYLASRASSSIIFALSNSISLHNSSFSLRSCSIISSSSILSINEYHHPII